MKIVEENVAENKIINYERIIEERLKDNIKLFNKKEIDIIKSNKDLVEKIYLLGILDCKKLLI